MILFAPGLLSIVGDDGEGGCVISPPPWLGVDAVVFVAVLIGNAVTIVVSVATAAFDDDEDAFSGFTLMDIS